MNDIRILVVEDDREINQLVTDSLKRAGFFADGVYSGAEALRQFSPGAYQMAILDLMLPEINGLAVLAEIRKTSSLPVLILSAKKEEADKVAGLSRGADDYLAKPFSVEELLARVRAQLRRYLTYTAAPDGEVLRCGELEINRKTYAVTAYGKPVTLTAKEFGILRLMITNPQKVFTKAQLFRTIWGEAYLSDENTVMVHIHRLREKIELDPANPRLIQTVWGIGYKLAAPE